MKMFFVSLFAVIAVSACPSRSGSAASITGQVAAAEPAVSIEWDKTVHDFGDVSVEDGPLTCSFTLKNTGKEPITIFEVVSSCGCTDVKFKRDNIEPGSTATISATYKNEDGPTAFDKTLTVYITGIRRPVILRLRGVVHPKKKSLSELYSTERLGDFGMKTRSLKTSGLKQGLSVSGSTIVANLGDIPLSVSFTEVSPQLSLTVTPNPIPAQSAASLSYTVKADPALYGKNTYHAVPVIGGEKQSGWIEVTTRTQENFSLWDSRQLENGSAPAFSQSTYSFNTVREGTKLQVEFICTNNGKSTFHIHKADSDSPALRVKELPDVAPGEKKTLVFTLDTALLPEGDNVIMITLTTNSPQRPIINLFVAGDVVPCGSK